MTPGNDGMLKTHLMFMTAADSHNGARGLTGLGEWQTRNFTTELLRGGQIKFDHILVAAHEADSWRTVCIVQEMTESLTVCFLKELALPDPSTPRGSEIARLIKRYPAQPIAACAGDSEYSALTSHSARALREIRPFVEPHRHQSILICARHGHVLSCLANYWATEMVYAGFKIQSHLAVPVGRSEVCHAANEFALGQAQGLTFRFDAHTPESQAVTPIKFLAGRPTVSN